MSFYQNPFDADFIQSWVLSDRQYSIDFKCPRNKNNNDLMLSWNNGPYDFSSVNTLTLYYAFDRDFKNWAALAINVVGDTPSATTTIEVMDALNANSIFADYFIAGLESPARGTRELSDRVIIRTKKPKHAFKFYIANTGAETKLKFNKYAGVADMPSYMDRHTIANRWNGTEAKPSSGCLVRLSHAITANTVANPTVITSTAHGLTTGDVIYIVNSNSTPTIDGQRTVTVTGANTFTVPVNVSTAGTKGEWLSTIEYNVVTDYGLTYSDMKEDYELLAGRSGLFTFQKITVDGSDRITQIIEYHAGAVAGDFGRKIQYSYTSSNTKPDQITEIPYQLVAGDLVTPS